MTTKSKYRKILKYIIHMKIAEKFSYLSYDTKHQVASIAVRKDFKDIHKCGYNGNFEGGSNERDSLEHGNSGFIHAEENWLIKNNLDEYQLSNYILFVTMTPCENCMKRLINAGIKEVCILNEYINCGRTFEYANVSGVTIYTLKEKVIELLNSVETPNDLPNLVEDFFDVNDKIKVDYKNCNITSNLYDDFYNILYSVL